jgi:uncharacterized SAM-binding protein YcdF (DUF218 family)
MFVLSKVYLYLSSPGVWAFGLLLAGTVLLWTRWRRAGRWLLTATVAFIAVVTVLPAGPAMLIVLENRFPTLIEPEPPVHGIIVLGGSVDQFVTQARGQPALTDGAERLTEAVTLARLFPDARIVFTGGSGRLTRQDVKETTVATMFFARMGLDPDRLELEEDSRNTFENAVFTRRMVGPKPEERWLLVTSAGHMARSVGAFRKAGWEPIPYPVDYRTTGFGALRFGTDMVSGLGTFSVALREYMALAVYRALGRTDTLFPAPRPEAGQGVPP